MHTATLRAQHAAPSATQLELRLSPAKPILADAALLQQALHAMLQNACAASQKGSIVVGAGYAKERDRAFLYVRDAGRGTSLQAVLAAHAMAAVRGAHGHWRTRLITGTAAAHGCAAAGVGVAQRASPLLHAALAPCAACCPQRLCSSCGSHVATACGAQQ